MFRSSRYRHGELAVSFFEIMYIGRFSFVSNVKSVLREVVCFVKDVSGVGELAASLFLRFPVLATPLPFPPHVSRQLPSSSSLLSAISLPTSSLLCMQSQSLKAVAISS